MNNSDEAPQSTPRPTIKLKVSPRKPPEPVKVTPAPQMRKPEPKPGARWSDEYKERMQADMDALASG